MTTPAPIPTPTRSASGPRLNLVASMRSRARRDQLVCLIIAILLFIGIFAIQPSLHARRAALVQRTTNAKNIGHLLLTFPRLALGGFRGVLAMVLWEDAESDKNNHKWRPLETDYQAIATIEPYFGSVYIFNAWNMSYNLSAQFHSMNTKYKWVLDGLVSLYHGEKFVPDNANVIMNEANDYFLKLGASFERKYYSPRWRYDIAHLYRYNPKKISSGLSSLGQVYYLVTRPEFHCKLLKPLGGHGPVGHGVKIHGLTYRYGLSPFYFAWCEYNRALHQPKLPTDMGIEVLHSWKPMCLRLWCRDDCFYAQRLTNRIFNADTEKKMLVHFPARVENIHDCYRNIKINGPRSIHEFQVFLQKYPDQRAVHRSHIYEVRFYQALAAAEGTLFQGLVQWQLNHRQFRLGDAADRKLAAAVPLYEKAMTAYENYLSVAFPTARNGQMNPGLKGQRKYLRAMRARIDGIDSFRLTAAHHKPDMSFLQPVTLSYSD